MPPPSHLRQSGSARDAQVRDRMDSHPASFFTGESFAYYDEPPTSHSTSRSDAWTTRAGESPDRHQHRYANTISDADLDCPPYNYYPLRSNTGGHQHYQEVPRPRRGAHDPRFHQAPDGRDSQDAITRNSTHGTNSRCQSRTSTAQPRSTNNERHEREAYLLNNSRPLGYSNLQNLNRDRPPTTAMRRLAREERKEKQARPYDAVGYVGRQSDYDKPRSQSRHNRRREEGFGDAGDEEMEYEYNNDGGCSSTFR